MHVRRAMSLALLIPVLLGGCAGNEPKPKMPDPTTSSPSPTPTEQATAKAESAEEFIRRWQAVGDEMQVTGETGEYDAMTPQCQACQAFVENVAEVYEGGGNAEFSGAEIIDIERVGQTPPTFDVTKDVPATVIHEPSGKTRTLPRGRTTIRVTLGKARSRWVVTHFGVLS